MSHTTITFSCYTWKSQSKWEVESKNVTNIRWLKLKLRWVDSASSAKTTLKNPNNLLWESISNLKKAITWKWEKHSRSRDRMGLLQTFASAKIRIAHYRKCLKNRDKWIGKVWNALLTSKSAWEILVFFKDSRFKNDTTVRVDISLHESFPSNSC